MYVHVCKTLIVRNALLYFKEVHVTITTHVYIACANLSFFILRESSGYDTLENEEVQDISTIDDRAVTDGTCAIAYGSFATLTVIKIYIRIHFDHAY